MHYCKDENLVLLDPIDNAIGEPVYKTAPHVFFYDRPGGGVIDKEGDRVKPSKFDWQEFNFTSD